MDENEKKDAELFDGRYRLDSDPPIGEGGMGKIFSAFDTKLERKVAIKVLHGEYATNPEAIRRFIGEARAAARSHHENIVQVLDYGQVGDEYYIVLELLSGRCLRDMRLGTFADAQIADIFIQICDGLQAAHDNGVVHRDLKPENIYLVPLRDGRVRVKILDFGVALIRHLKPIVGESGRRFTKAGTTLGTPHYMSIEQLAGRVDEIDARSDIYAMGVMIYEAVTGDVPFDGDSYEQVCALRMEADDPPTHPHMSSRFWPIIKKAMAKHREQRHAKIADLRKDLERLGHKRSQAVIEVLSELSDDAKDTPDIERLTPPQLRKTALAWTDNGHKARHGSKRLIAVVAAVALIGMTVGIAAPLIFSRGSPRRAVQGAGRMVEADVVHRLPSQEDVTTPVSVGSVNRDAGLAISATSPRADASASSRNARPASRRPSATSPRRRCVNRSATDENCVEIE